MPFSAIYKAHAHSYYIKYGIKQNNKNKNF